MAIGGRRAVVQKSLRAVITCQHLSCGGGGGINF